jgi:broad specificity phosphatase PhoE
MSATTKIINHLNKCESLAQSYYALRHGQSLANVAKIISSDPNISTVQHGLSDVGRQQAKAAGDAFAAEYVGSSSESTSNDNYRGVAIFSSDFARARETASIFAQSLRSLGIPLYGGGVELERRLRERYFGELNGGPDTGYQAVWDRDVGDADHNEFGVESANSVLERTTKFISELDGRLSHQSENDGSRWKCVLVAHGDVLQITQTGFLRHADASRHRSLQHLETATIRELILVR